MSFLKKLKMLNLENEAFGEVSKLIDSNLGTIPFEGIMIKKGTELFRARKQPLFQDQKFSKLAELTIRNDVDIKAYGRANLPGQAVFYSSLTKETAAREVTQWQIDELGALISKGIGIQNYNPFTQFMTISKWITKEDLFFYSTMPPEPSNNQSAVNPLMLYQQHKYEFDVNRYQASQRLILDFFRSEFEKQDIRGNFDYYYSAYYSNIIYALMNRAPVAGLIYLSVAFDHEGINIAIPKSKLEMIKFDSAEFCYTYNSNGRPGFENTKIVVAPVFKSTLSTEDSLIWVEVQPL
jgi:hypothetical protein